MKPARSSYVCADLCHWANEACFASDLRHMFAHRLMQRQKRENGELWQEIRGHYLPPQRPFPEKPCQSS